MPIIVGLIGVCLLVGCAVGVLKWRAQKTNEDDEFTQIKDDERDAPAEGAALN